MKTITKLTDVPKTEHWAIISFRTIHVPGDERSRTHPGHGYPARDEPSASYEVFTSKAEWIAEVLKRETERLSSTYRCDKNWVAVKINPAELRTTVSVVIDGD